MIVYTRDSLRIHCIPAGPLATNAYWIDTGLVSCLVDPILDPADKPEPTSRLHLIIATHGHFDHIGHCDDWRTRESLKLAIHTLDKEFLPDARLNGSALFGQPSEFYPADLELHDQQVIQLDADTSIQVIHTPGHTPGSICLLILRKDQPQVILTGDTLFAGSVGRVDLPGGNAAQLMTSLDRLTRVSEIFGQDLPVLPGHGLLTTLREELRSNPWLTGHARFKAL